MFSKFKTKFSSSPDVTSKPSNLRTICTETEANAAATRFEIAANKIDQAAIKITDIANKFDNYFLPAVPENQETVYPSLTTENLQNLQVPSRNLPRSRTASISSIPSSQVSEEYRKLGLEPGQLSRTNSLSSLKTSENLQQPSSSRTSSLASVETPEYLQLPSSSRTSSISSEQNIHAEPNVKEPIINNPPSFLPPPVPQGVRPFSEKNSSIVIPSSEQNLQVQPNPILTPSSEEIRQVQPNPILTPSSEQNLQVQPNPILTPSSEEIRQVTPTSQSDILKKEGKERQIIPTVTTNEIKEAQNIIKKYNNEEYLNGTVNDYPISEYIKTLNTDKDNYFIFIDKTNSDYYVIGKNIEYFYPFEIFGDKYAKDQAYKYAIQFDSMFGYIDYASISKLQDNYYFIFPVIDFDATDNDPNDVQLYDDLENMFDILTRAYESYPKIYENQLLNFMTKTDAYIHSLNLSRDDVMSKDKIMKKITSKPGFITKKVNKIINKIPYKINNVTRKLSNLNPFKSKSNSGGRRTRRVPRKKITKKVLRKRIVPRKRRRTKRNN
jgi:hypothetical protein